MNLRPLATIVAVVFVAEAVLLLTDTGPDVWLVAALVGVVGVTTWFMTTIDRVAVRPTPSPVTPTNTSSFPDLRTTALRQALATGHSDARHARRLRDQLVTIVDDELLTAHGIDRDADPDAARVVLGDELDRFLHHAEPGAPLTMRDVTRIITLIEHLSDTEQR